MVEVSVTFEEIANQVRTSISFIHKDTALVIAFAISE